jgi:CHAT domain-containing protein
MVRGPGQMPVAQYKAMIDDARREGEAAEQALAEGSADFRAERSRAQIGLDAVTSALPADAVLLSFVRYGRSAFATAPASSRTIPSYAALVLRHGLPVAAVHLGTVQGVDALVSQWRADIAAEALTTSEGSSHPAAPGSRVSGDALRRRVWDRLAPHVGKAARVFIVPDGALSLVPFAALPVGSRSFLLESGPVIHYLSAERDLVPVAPAPSSGRTLLAVGGPSFDDRRVFRAPANPSPEAVAGVPRLRGAAAAGCGGLQAVVFQPLDGTLQEVRDLSRVWTASTATGSDAARTLVGAEASETRFKREAPGSRVLHLATHGFFIDGTCSGGFGGTRGVGGLARTAPARAVENPLLLSGLALAGANRRASARPDEDDGILTAEEVASLDLEGVEWAVLSACDTGVGAIKAGEGVFGLRRAFQVAGARTVLMSLWSVDDQATRAWMRALYDGRFQRNLSTADAVHGANLSVLRARRARGQSTHPFYWAAFVAVGDWR